MNEPAPAVNSTYWSRIVSFGRAKRLHAAATSLERASRADLDRAQRERFAGMARHAAANSPFYRDLYRGIDLSGEVDPQSLPSVDKATLAARFDDWVTDPRLREKEVEAHVETLVGDGLHLGEYRVCATGGTTGRRGLFLFSRPDWESALAGFLRFNELMGVRPRFPRIRVATVLASHPLHMTARFGLTVDVGAMRLQRFDARRPVRELAQRLQEWQPDFLSGYPSIVALLADEQLAGRLRISPQVVSTSSETRTAEMTDRIRAAWGREPFDAYASTETAFMAVECDAHRGLHVFEDLVHLENVDAAGVPVPDGTPGHHLLVTNLWNRTQPIVRYALTDMVTIDPTPCPCGLTFRRIVSVQGRADDVIHLRNARNQSVPIHPLALRSPFAALPAVRQYQIIWDGVRLTVRVVPADGLAGAGTVTDLVATALRAKLAELDVPPPPIDVVPLAELARDDGHGGKFKLIEVRRPAGGPAAAAAS